MIKGTETLAQYKIAQWVEDNFEEDSVQVTYTGPRTATITDKQNESMQVIWNSREKMVQEVY